MHVKRTIVGTMVAESHNPHIFDIVLHSRDAIMLLLFYIQTYDNIIILFEGNTVIYYDCRCLFKCPLIFFTNV